MLSGFLTPPSRQPRNSSASAKIDGPTPLPFPYVITRKEDGELLGMIEVRPRGHRANFGYVLARSYWGNGFMPEAIAAIVKITLNLPEIYRMEATCDIENKASARALEKSGFFREGLLRRYIIHPNISPEPRDSLLYALTK